MDENIKRVQTMGIEALLRQQRPDLASDWLLHKQLEENLGNLRPSAAGNLINAFICSALFINSIAPIWLVLGLGQLGMLLF